MHSKPVCIIDGPYVIVRRKIYSRRGHGNDGSINVQVRLFVWLLNLIKRRVTLAVVRRKLFGPATNLFSVDWGDGAGKGSYQAYERARSCKNLVKQLGKSVNVVRTRSSVRMLTDRKRFPDIGRTYLDVYLHICHLHDAFVPCSLWCLATASSLPDDLKPKVKRHKVCVKI